MNALQEQLAAVLFPNREPLCDTKNEVDERKRMTHLGEAVARYHKLLETDTFRDNAWLAQLREQMEANHLVVNGRPVSPVLRPHFLSRRQYSNLAAAAEALTAAIERVRGVALNNPALLARMQLLPAEKMLAAVDPGYKHPSVTAWLDTQVSNGSVHFVDCRADLPVGMVLAERLADVFYDSAPVKAFRKKFKLAKTGGVKPLISALLKTFKDFGGRKQPNIAVLEFRQPFQSGDSHEAALLVEILRQHGYAAEIVSPDQLEYRNEVLRRGDFAIDLVYRGVRAHEFLLRFDLTHPLVRAYREGKVCVVNSFRSELTRRMALFDLLTDETVTASFPAAERKAIRDSIPWTRVVAASRTTYKDSQVDLLEFIQSNRELLVLRPNDDSSEQPSFDGSRTEAAGWERALRIALRNPYVVQERLEPAPTPFPVDLYGDIVIRELAVDVHPHAFQGKVQGCSSHVRSADGAFSSLAGLAPTFLLESR
jgi:hypothetical protein